jgi:hypothetical protein
MPGPYHPLVEQWKSISGTVEWSSPLAPEDGAITFLVPLEIDGVTIAGFALRGKAYGHLPDEAVSLQIEIGHDGLRRRTPLVRIDWRPRSPFHQNSDKKRFGGSHEHLFEDNWLEGEHRMRTGNLPEARKIAEIHAFKELLDYAMILFRINDINKVPEPEWSSKLL